MCGIVGYIGPKEKKSILLDGLQELEYRGYDSAGFAVISGGKLSHFKAVGKLANLRKKAADFTSEGPGAAIGHTRWATHGKPTELNAHPHMGAFSYVVHNGIIENYRPLKEELEAQGVRFLSQTDTEVIVHLFEQKIREGLEPFEAFRATIGRLEGAYAILLISEAAPETIFFAKNGSPLLIALDGEEIYFASSDTAVIGKAQEAYYLEDGEYGYARPREVRLYGPDDEPKALTTIPLPSDKAMAQKDGYRFFMEKEIYEQSTVIGDTILGRVLDEGIEFEELPDGFFDGIASITICACGTSYHAGLTGAYLLERMARIPCRVEIASEFRYKEPLLSPDTLFVTISQSGETADTLEALKMAKRAGLR
ncbi:glutamine--fructose-6-phosphate transaminase (isomerizing), partial [Nitratifractor sp.]